MATRNNTNFCSEASGFLKSIHMDKNDMLKYHQRIIHEYFLKYKLRGMLLFHEMGTGKTYLAAAIARTFVKNRKRVLFISNKTLQSNFEHTYKRMYNDFESINLITLTANNMYHQVEDSTGAMDVLTGEIEANLENCIIIIDEAHRFFNGICNGSKNYINLYQKILNTRNCNIVLMTGTPIMSHPFELAVAYNMLAGYLSVGKEKHTLFGEDYEDFCKFFITDDRIRNADKFADRIVGLSSYFGIGLNPDFPRVLETKVIHVKMSEYQYSQYIILAEKEHPTGNVYHRKPGRLQRPQHGSGSFRTKTRQAGNIWYPRKYYSEVKDHVIGKIMEVVDITDIKADFYGPSIADYSPKIIALLVNIAKHLPKRVLEKTRIKEYLPANISIGGMGPDVGPGIIYSQFLTYGLDMITRVLKHIGFIQVPENGDGPKFAVISGEVDPEVRNQIVKLTVDPENKEGDKFALLLISMTGSEGISTKYMKHVHIFEPYWLSSVMDQIKFRAARLDSHRDLPMDQRIVQPYVYLSKSPVNTETTDEYIYENSMRNKALCMEFYELIKRSSVDCLLNYNHCRSCKPTNRALFHPDLYKDILVPSVCEYEKTIEAKKVVLGDKTYMVSANKIYTYDNELGGYVELDPELDEYREIHSAVKAAIKGGDEIDEMDIVPVMEYDEFSKIELWEMD